MLRSFRGIYIRRNSLKRNDNEEKIIYGKVYEDSEGNEVKGVSDVEIKLFLAKKSSSEEDGEKGVTIYNEKLIKTARTNKSGEFDFSVRDGVYSLNVNIDTLPEGKGVTESNFFIEEVDSERIDFIVRDVYSIEVEAGRTRNLHIGEPIVFNPIVKDIFGSRLTAKLKCSSDEAMRASENIIEFKPGNFEGKWTNVNIATGKAMVQIPVEIKMPEAPMLERIDIAYSNGVIDEKAKMLFYIYAMFDKSKIVRGQGIEEVPMKSGTIIMQEILDYIKRKDADSIVVETAKKYLDTPLPTLDKEYRSPGGFFKIHYTTSGVHAVAMEGADDKGVPDYIRKVGMAFDEVKNNICNDMGFRKPLTGSGKAYDIYVYNLDGKYGVTVSLKFLSKERYRPRRASSYICIDNSYVSSKGFKLVRDDCMRVTAAHEFFHAVQYAYNVDADIWWKEASATWMEDEIYNSINDYVQYIKRYFAHPQKSLEDDTYSRVLFVKYISEKWGGHKTVRRIWEIQGTQHRKSINAIDAAIKERFKNKDIGIVFNEFTAWNYNPAQYYEEGEMWQQAINIENTHMSYPVSEKKGLLNHLASSYQLFRVDNLYTGKNLVITIDCMDSTKWGFKVQKRRISDGVCELTGIISGDSSRIEIVINNFAESLSEVCLIPANIEKEKNASSYSYSASFI